MKAGTPPLQQSKYISNCKVVCVLANNALSMHKYLSYIVCTVGLVAGTMNAGAWESGLVARIHFAGGDAVTADPNSAPLRNVWSSPEALALRAQTLNKLSRFLDGWVRQQVAPNLAAPLQSQALLADLCLSEWQLEVHQPVAGAVDFRLAVRLDNARAQAWQTTLNPVVEGWKKSSAAHHGHLIHNGNWLFLAMDNGPAAAAEGAVAGLNHEWLTTEVDWTRLAVWFPGLRAFDLPQIHLQVTGRNGNFETTGKLYLAQSLPPMQPWLFPTNMVHSPFVSFTAARGISDWLRQQPWVASLGINPLPNQVFTWVQPQIPFLTFAALPMANAAAALPNLDRSITAALKADQPGSTYAGFSVSATNRQITLLGMPFMAPYFEARHDSGSEFLVGGFLPLVPKGKPSPPELFARLNEPNLVFYHWEMTSERLKIFPELYQLLFVVSRHRQLDDKSAAGIWIDHLAPGLGATVTTATETGPNELSFSRKAPAGLTAVELVALGSWLEAPNFPGCDLRMPPPRKHRPHPNAAGGAPTLNPHP